MDNRAVEEVSLLMMRRKWGRNGALKEPKKTIDELIGPNLEWILVEMANGDFAKNRKQKSGVFSYSKTIQKKT
jgi:hypothetical protein